MRLCVRSAVQSGPLSSVVRIGAWTLIVLALLVVVEWRVAEADLNPRRGVDVESDGGVEGGEVLDRLLGSIAIELPRPAEIPQPSIVAAVLVSAHAAGAPAPQWTSRAPPRRPTR